LGVWGFGVLGVWVGFTRGRLTCDQRGAARRLEQQQQHAEEEQPTGGPGGGTRRRRRAHAQEQHPPGRATSRAINKNTNVKNKIKIQRRARAADPRRTGPVFIPEKEEKKEAEENPPRCVCWPEMQSGTQPALQ